MMDMEDHPAYATQLGDKPSRELWNSLLAAVEERNLPRALVELWRLCPCFGCLLDETHVDMSAVEAAVGLLAKGRRGFEAGSRIFGKLALNWHTGQLNSPSAWLATAVREAERHVQREAEEEEEIRLSRERQERLEQGLQWNSGWGAQWQGGWGEYRSGPYWQQG